jgi:glycosyltransferase involved in cell wall biosynthesis
LSKKDVFSIITVVFNDSINLEKTILSIRNQIGVDFQYIVIDGGSTDETIQIVEKYDHIIDVFVSEKDNGIYDAMNKGLSFASGSWINFLNAGDLYSGSTFLKELSIRISNTKSKIINTDFIIDNCTFSPIINRYYLLRGMPCHQSIFYKSELFYNNKYNIKYRYCADFHHLIQIFNTTSVLRVSGLKVHYLGNGFSANKHARKSILNERFEIMYNSNFGLMYRLAFLFVNRLQYLKHSLCFFQL